MTKEITFTIYAIGKTGLEILSEWLIKQTEFNNDPWFHISDLTITIKHIEDELKNV